MRAQVIILFEGERGSLDTIMDKLKVDFNTEQDIKGVVLRPLPEPTVRLKRDAKGNLFEPAE